MTSPFITERIAIVTRVREKWYLTRLDIEFIYNDTAGHVKNCDMSLFIHALSLKGSSVEPTSKLGGNLTNHVLLCHVN